jgi:hypothetical protein
LGLWVGVGQIKWAGPGTIRLTHKSHLYELISMMMS